MHISNKAISLLAAVGLIAAQLLTPVAAYAETDSAVADQVEAAATDDNFGFEIRTSLSFPEVLFAMKTES